jgi:hypothetical protein
MRLIITSTFCLIWVSFCPIKSHFGLVLVNDTIKSLFGLLWSHLGDQDQTQTKPLKETKRRLIRD